MPRSMRSLKRPRQRASRSSWFDWPIVVYLWLFVGGFGGYLIARLAADAYPHPVHWLSGVAGAAVGWGLGWLWYRWRGDIIPG